MQPVITFFKLELQIASSINHRSLPLQFNYFTSGYCLVVFAKSSISSAAISSHSTAVADTESEALAVQFTQYAN